MRRNIQKKTWGVLGKQKTYYAPSQYLEGKTKVPLNNTPVDAWDYKKSKYYRVDLVPNEIQQHGVVPQVTSTGPSITPSPTPTITTTNTPSFTPTNTPSVTPTAACMDVGTGFTNNVTKISFHSSNSKAFVIGGFTSYTNTLINRFISLNFDGSIDTGFSVGSGYSFTGATPTLQRIFVQSDGKILLASGTNTAGQTWQGNNVNQVFRLNSDGTLDGGFASANSSGTFVITDLVEDFSGKTLVFGALTTYSGVTVPGLVRLNTDGTIDNTFSAFTRTPGSATINAVLPLSDGKYLVGGNFTAVGGSSRGRIARINSDGSNDATFTSVGFTGGTANVQGIILQSDGKYFIRGANFTNYSGQSISNSICRLNSDFTLDTTFSGQNFLGSVNIVEQLNDGKYVIGGAFTQYSGVTIGRGILRLNSDGTRDTSFVTGTGFNGNVLDFLIDTNGDIIAVGSFTTYDSYGPYNFIARLNSNGDLDMCTEILVTPTPSATATRTPTPSITSTQTETPTNTPSVTQTNTPTESPTNTVTPSETPTSTPTPSVTSPQTFNLMSENNENLEAENGDLIQYEN